MSDFADLFPGYASEWISTRAGRIFARVGGKGPPLLLLHGFSETHVMWHRVAPQLADRFTLVIADLPGYGWSDMPESDADHTPYTKRAMAQTIVEAMEQLGYVHFALAGHDRGGRVAYRLALEHYLAAFRDPSRVHAMCEDYRAGAYADFDIDKADRDTGKKITIPMLALWGDAGIARAAATPLETWKNWASNVSGSPIDSGHFLTEENPTATAKALRKFFGAK